MKTPFKLKYKNSAFPFKSPLKHDEDWKGNKLEEHAHSEGASRSSRTEELCIGVMLYTK